MASSDCGRALRRASATRAKYQQSSGREMLVAAAQTRAGCITLTARSRRCYEMRDGLLLSLFEADVLAMKLPPFEYSCPTSLSEAVALLAVHGSEAKPLAGGQSLVPMLAFRVAAPAIVIDLRKLKELQQIKISDLGVTLGAMVRWRDILDDARLRSAHPLLVEAIAHVAHYQIRNRGTVGGSLAHADPAAEMPGIAVACDAEIAVASKAATRTIAADDFFRGPLTTALKPDEIITGIRLPPWPKQRRFGFQEFARRRGDFATAGVALFYDQDGGGKVEGAHIGVIGVADRPLRLAAAENVLNGQRADDITIAEVAAAASAAVDPADDIHGGGAYRRVLLRTLVERALKSAA
jgi:aerobic carbon-monoxide dehydrogenase medium subunit